MRTRVFIDVHGNETLLMHRLFIFQLILSSLICLNERTTAAIKSDRNPVHTYYNFWLGECHLKFYNQIFHILNVEVYSSGNFVMELIEINFTYHV